MERMMIEQPKLRDLKPEEHGPVIEIRSDYSSHGMSMGSSSYGKETVSWQQDGNVVIECTENRNGKETHEKYLAGSEAAERLRQFIKESRVAEMAQVPPIPSPYQLTDCSSSSFITFVFDDADSKAERKLDYGSYWDVQRKASSKIRDLIKECIDSGKSLETWICPQCNTENKGKYCMECGRKRDA